MKEFLGKLCDLAPKDLFEELKKTARLNEEWESDWQFYQNMCQPEQIGYMAGDDLKLAKKEALKQKKLDVAKALKAASLKRNIDNKVSGEEFDDGKERKEVESDTEEIHEGKKTKKDKSEKIFLEIDPKKLVEQTTAASDRLGLSARQSSMMLAAVVKAGGGDVSKVSLSKSRVHEKRKETRFTKGKGIMDSFIPSKTGYILHYDTKLVSPKGRDTEDRAAVLYSGGPYKQPHLLGIPKFLSSAGRDVEAGVLRELKQYNVLVQDCLGTCYDTTASNSGHQNGAHFRIERNVGHAILELECRKHVHEVHVTHANKAIFGLTKGPQKAHYKDFKTAWSSLKLDTTSLKLFDWEKYSEQKFLTCRAKQSLEWAEDNLQNNTFPRDDYKELNELIVVYLGGEVHGGFVPKCKGAMHDARFMADSIYLLSMELFFNEYIMKSSMADKVQKMAVFVAIWHAPNFLKCSLAAAAPSNDLQYFYDMQDLFDVEDPDMSRIGAYVSDSIQRHTSYLKAPQVIFALFNEKLEPTERQTLAAALAAIPRPDSSPDHFRPGKLADIPLVCSMKECVGSSLCIDDSDLPFPKKTLASFVGVKSYLLFNLLHIEDLSWLEAPVALWDCFPSYSVSKNFVKDLVVVNDGAERGTVT